MRTLILSFCTAALLSTASNVSMAQIGFGPEGGLNVSNYTGFAGGVYTNTTIHTGVRLGLDLNTPIAGNFFLDRGLNYVMNGYKDQVNGQTLSVRVNTAELPLSLQYKFRANSEGDRIFVGIGPYLAFNFGGRYKIAGTDIDRKLSMGSDQPDDMKVVDFGGGINAGYQVGNGVFIRAHAQLGFVNLRPYGDVNNAIYNSNFGVTIGYLFMHECKCAEHHDGCMKK